MNGIQGFMLVPSNYDFIGWALAHSTWQLTVIGLAYWMIAAMLRKRAPQTIYLLSCVTLVAMFVVPLATGIYCLDQEQMAATDSEPTVRAAVENVAAQPQRSSGDANPIALPALVTVDSTADLSDRKVVAPWTFAVVKQWLAAWLPTLTWLWFAGVLIGSLRPLLGLWTVRRLKRTGLTELPVHVVALADSLVERMKVSRACQFAGSSVVTVPMVIGYFKPLVLLPASAITGLSVQELETIMSHELGHVRRHDYLVNLIQTVIETLLFYHPAVWLVSRQIRIQRENCCDDIAVAVCGSPVTYARALAKLESGRPASGGLALAASDGSLVERIGRLLGRPVGNPRGRGMTSWLAGLLTISIVGVALAMGGEKSDEDKAMADPAAAPSAGLSPRETVSQFLKQLAEGKKKSTKTSGSWDHAYAYTTREDGWSGELVKLAGNEAFRPIASLGTKDRMMVVVSARRDVVFGDSPKAGVFDLVKKDGRWLIEGMDVYQHESAWSTVDGFARNDDVRWEVTRDDIIGNFLVGFRCIGPDTFAEDGTWKTSLRGGAVKTGTWRLEGDVLVCEGDEKVTRSRIAMFINGGFMVETDKKQFGINEDIADEIDVMIPGKWQTAFYRTAKQAGAKLVGQPRGESIGDNVGQIFGMPITREQLNDKSINELVLPRLVAEYKKKHLKEIEPTKEEIVRAAAYFDAEHQKRIKDDRSGLEASLAKFQSELSADALPEGKRSELKIRMQTVEAQLEPPGRMFAEFILKNWKYQKHLYDSYGGGRIMFQQMGLEAFDATHSWLQGQEKQGAFKIDDAKLRTELFQYWTSQDDSSFLTDDPEKFINPPWSIKR